MAITHVQTSTEVVVSAGSSGQVTLTGVVAGNLLVAVLCQPVSSVRTYTFSDNVNGAWEVGEELQSGQTAHISYLKNAGAGDTLVTGTINTATGTFRFKVLEFSGVDTVSPKDVSSELAESVATNTHACAATSTEIDTVANVLVVCAGVLTSSGTAVSAGGTYTDIGSALTDFVLWQYKTSANALVDEQGTWTHTGTARTARSVMVAFKGAAEAGGIIQNMMLG